jgi:adenosylhomocysteine nucleosidase
MLKTVAGRRLLYVMAADAEYGRHLAKLFDPLMIGVGPVEAAINLSRALFRMERDGEQPDLVVSSVSYRDMDASPLGFEKGLTPFLDLPKMIKLPYQVEGLASATLSTGANVVSGKVYETIDADMVDMETFACLRACQIHGVPLYGLRGISDGADELHHVGDWTQYLHVIDEKMAVAVEELEAAIAGGLLPPPDNGVSG